MASCGKVYGLKQKYNYYSAKATQCSIKNPGWLVPGVKQKQIVLAIIRPLIGLRSKVLNYPVCCHNRHIGIQVMTE